MSIIIFIWLYSYFFFRHLLSADTKDERIEWCEMFNKALIALKMWGKNT